MGYLDIVNTLLAHQAQVDITDTQGQTALMLATGLGKGDALPVLLKHGANPNAQDEDGRTALMRAAETAN